MKNTDINWLADWLQALCESSNLYKPEKVGVLDELKEGAALLAAYQL